VAGKGGGEMRRVMKIVILITVLYILIMPAYMASSLNSKPCRGVVINIRDSADYHFVTRRQLLNLVYREGGKIPGKPVKEINVQGIEERINDLRELKIAETYISVDGMLNVYVDQRDPVMRVMPSTGGDFFVDREGIVVRKRNLYTPRLHLVVGNIVISQAMLDGISIFDTTIRRSVLRDAFTFIRYIDDDSFWSSQIDQIYVDGKDEIDLIPRVGKHVIHLGTFDNYEEKLRNLKAFYRKVMPVAGWNRYSRINLKYEGQIVCKREN
jgi:cell division protein FtsQ